jgi:hypothetical protein
MKTLNINRERLQTDIETLATIGREAGHGIYRMAFTEADMQSREWYKQRALEEGLDVYTVTTLKDRYARVKSTDDALKEIKRVV